MKISYLCPHFQIVGNLDPSLNPVEKNLVCGEEEKGKSEPGSAWAKIPFPQARYNLKNFLQVRGYHHPQFFDLGNNQYQVIIGDRSRISSIQLETEITGLDVSRMRKVLGEPLTPSMLDKIEGWVSERLRNQGYACPKVMSRADPETGEVFVQAKEGQPQPIVSVTSEPIPETKEEILRRYDAFELGQLFDERLLTVTSNRILQSGVLESTHLRSSCEKDGVHLRQDVIPGRPHLLIAGAGVNTEGFLLGKFSWKNTRLGPTASLFDVSASGSSKIQTLRGTMNWYFLPEVSRTYLNPVVQFNHDNEQHFEVIYTTTQMGLASTLDHGDLSLLYFLGPTLNYYRTVSGYGAPFTRLFVLEGRLVLKSHLYEYYSSNPQTGFILSLMGDLNSQAFLSDVAAQKISLFGEALWNINHYEPPFLIVGVRWGLNSIFTGAPTGFNTPLPATYLQYLGGSSNLRGFGRQELALDSNGGGLTSGFLGLEWRLSQTLPMGFDPFVFFDLGALGSRPASFDSPLYWSPGFGVRWASPVGGLRTTLAHGYSNSVANHWQFYFSLGEEF